MKFYSLLGPILLILSLSVFAQEVPLSNPSEVWVKGRKMDHSWREGRIWVPASQLDPLLNLHESSWSVDLLRALEQKGGYLWNMVDGKFEAKPDPRFYSDRVPTDARAKNALYVRYATAIKRKEEKKAAAIGQLAYSVQEVVATTGYVRAWVVVGNEGPGPSDPSTMFVTFHDWFGHPYAHYKTVVSALNPGEFKKFECFLLVKKEDTSLTPTTDSVSVNFFSLIDSSKNPRSTKEARSQSRKAKRGGGVLDFNRYPTTLVRPLR